MTDKQFYNAWIEIPSYTDRDAYISDVALSSMWEDDPESDVPQDRIDALGRMWDVYHMTMRDIRKASGMTQAAFSVRFLIPKRTVENWDEGANTPPDYVKIMISREIGIL